jgi:hypothetical protein
MLRYGTDTAHGTTLEPRVLADLPHSLPNPASTTQGVKRKDKDMHSFSQGRWRVQKAEKGVSRQRQWMQKTYLTHLRHDCKPQSNDSGNGDCSGSNFSLSQKLIGS